MGHGAGADDVVICELETLDLRLEPGRWAFEDDYGARIARHWDAACRANPALFNGRVLMMTRCSLAGGRLEGGLVEASFAAFLAWRDWGFPDAGVVNCFGSAAILSADGALLYGEMAPHTANAGLVYPPGGSLEPCDADARGQVDMARAIARELGEETGLEACEARDEGLVAVREGPRLSVAQRLRFPMSAARLVSRIGDHLDTEAEPELARIVSVAALTADEAGRMPAYARLLAGALAI